MSNADGDLKIHNKIVNSVNNYNHTSKVFVNVKQTNKHPVCETIILQFDILKMGQSPLFGSIENKFNTGPGVSS